MAHICGVATKRLNEQVRRNAKRFPPDFMFRLRPEEFAALRSQIATGSAKHRDLYAKIRTLLLPPATARPRKIGFHVKEAGAHYHRRLARGA